MHRVIAVIMFAVLIFPAVGISQPEAEIYALVRVDISPPGGGDALLSNPDLDIFDHQPGSHIDIIARPADLQWLLSVGAHYEVIHQDMAAYYAARLTDKSTDYGAFHTFDEVVAWLDQLHASYPNVVSAKWNIGYSHEGRSIWCVRVSDNPDVDEAEPEVLIDGMHHAREIMASEVPMMLIEHLASNYGVDPVVTWLLDNREIYVVPVVNPDGSVYNQLTNPEGGGLWRKNRRNNGEGIFGVDINRNYRYQWVGDGSSTDPESNTYRGPWAGSEPETQAVMGLVNAHRFITAMSFHSSGEMTLYPWGFTLTPSADDEAFMQIAGTMTRENGYASGTPRELLYPVNGVSQDWVYGAWAQHEKVFSFINEIGIKLEDGFWPLEARRDALFQDNLWPAMCLIMSAGAFMDASNPVVTGGDGDAFLNAGETVGLAFDLQNLGVDTSVGAFDVALHSDDPYIRFIENRRSFSGLGPLEINDLTSEPFLIEVDPNLPPSRMVAVKVTITAPGAGGVTTYDLLYPAGSWVEIFADDFETGAADWTMTGTWGTSTAESHSLTTSLTDSPVGFYQDLTFTTATSLPISLPWNASLTFWSKYEVLSWDYAYVHLSTDGDNWEPLYVSSGLQWSWTQEFIDLSPYGGQTVFLRYGLSTDYLTTGDGWFIDDVMVMGMGSTNALPAAPSSTSPLSVTLVDPTPDLIVAESSDPDGDPLTYGFRVFSDEAMTQLAASVMDVPASEGQVTWTVSPALPDGDYWWRAFAADPLERGLMGEVGTFTVSTTTSVGVDLGGFGLRVVSATGDRGAELMLQMPAAGDLRVDVYNARGQIVRTLATERMDRGAHLLTWDGRDAAGRMAASGVYFVRAHAGAQTATGRVLMVR